MASIQELSQRRAEALQAYQKATRELRDAEEHIRNQEPRPGKYLITAQWDLGRTYEYLFFRPEEAAGWYVTGRKGVLTWEEATKRFGGATLTIQRLHFKK